MEREAQRTAELLTTHAGGLRALAFELVGDAHAAEDVLQDTFLRSVGRVPASTSSSGVRTWLREVVRGLAKNHKRGAAHRAEREAVHARSTAARAEQDFERDARERSETLKRVVAAVVALDEPYRSVVLLRYFEGLSPTEIATRTNAPLATVASRLQRAHHQLRGELGRDGGDLVGALAPLLGFAWTSEHAGLAASTATIGKGVIVMGFKSAVAAAGVLLAALCWWWLAQGPDAPLARDEGAGASKTAAELSIAALDSGVDPGERAAREAALASSAPAASPNVAADATRGPGPYEFDLELLVVDQLGVPQSGATIDAAPDGQPLADLGITAWNGKLRKRWRAFAPVLELFVRAKSTSAGETDLRLVRIAAGAQERATLALPLPSDLGKGAAGITDTYVRVRATLELDGIDQASWYMARGASPWNREEFALDEHGNGVFLDPFLYAADPEPPVLGDLPLIGNLFRSSYVQLDGDFAFVVGGDVTNVLSQAEPARAEPETISVHGTVRLANGAPAAGVPVLLRCEKDDARHNAVADEYGAFAFEGLHAGPAIACSGAPGAGLVVRELVLDADADPIDLRLEDRGTLFVRLVDEGGAPLSGWRVEAWADAAERVYVRGAQCGEDGRAMLVDVGAAPLYLSARPASEDGATLPSRRIAERVWAQKDELVLVVAGGKELARLEFELASALGQSSVGGIARLVRGDGIACVPVRSHEQGEGAAMRRVWRLGGIVPGEYRLVAGAPGETWMDLGRLEILPGAKLVLGERRFAQRARVAIGLDAAGASERADGRLYVVRNGALTRSEDFSVRLPGEFGIPSGASSVAWTRSAAANGTGNSAPAEEPETTASLVTETGPVGERLPRGEGAPAATFEEPGAVETRALEGRPGATTNLVLPPAARAPR